MHNKTKRNDHRRDSKHLRKGWQKFCYDVKNLQEDEAIDYYIEKLTASNPQQIQI